MSKPMYDHYMKLARNAADKATAAMWAFEAKKMLNRMHEGKHDQEATNAAFAAASQSYNSAYAPEACDETGCTLDDDVAPVVEVTEEPPKPKAAKKAAKRTTK